MPRKITEDPTNLAYDIIRSVPHDDYEVIGHVLILRRGDEVMTCECGGGDVQVSVASPGKPWRTDYFNETDGISRMWK